MNLRLKKRALAATMGIAAFSALGAAIAPAAEAASGPVFTSGSCNSSSFFVECPVTWSGGTAPYTVQWTPVANFLSSGGTSTTSGNSSMTAGNCVPDTLYEVKVTVTDAAGLAATTYLGGRCDG
jgi:hypothetical protein